MKKNTFQNPSIVEEQIRKLTQQISYDVKEYTVEVLVNKFEKKEIFVPSFQRKYVWGIPRAIKFIESVILGIPIPFLFCADTTNGNLEIIDGVQRVTTLYKFFKNQISLDKLEKITMLSGEKFYDLPVVYQKRFLNRSIRAIVLKEDASTEIRMDLFHRINTGSLQLSKAEIRRGAFPGHFYDFIGKCANNDIFQKLCPLEEKKKDKAEDIELLLRFFALSDRYKEFDGKSAVFFDNYLKKQNNNALVINKEKEFLNLLTFVKNNLPYGFAKTKTSKSTPRVRFEALSVGINLALRINPNINIDMTNLLNSNEFKHATTSDASNLKKKLEYRIELVRDYILYRRLKPIPIYNN